MSSFWDFILGERRYDKLRQQLRPLLPSYWVEKRRWPVMTGPLVWEGRELDPSNYAYSFSSADVHEICGALDGFKELDLDGPDISADNFKLPTLGPKLRSFADVIHTGPGFYILQGLKLPGYSVEDRTLAFLGISSFIGEQRAIQGWNRDMLSANFHQTHIVELSAGETAGWNPAHHHHTEDEPCDIVAFDIRSPSAELFSLASAWKVYNRMRANDVTRLSAFDNQKGAASLHARATARSLHSHYQSDPGAELHLHQGKIIMNIGSKYRSSSRAVWGHFRREFSTGIVKEVDGHAGATSVSLRPNNGDLLFINNLAVLHRITSPSERGRHIVKLWLRNKNLRWQLPSHLEETMRDRYAPSTLKPRWMLRPPERLKPQHATNQVTTGRAEASATVPTQTQCTATDNESIGSFSIGGISFGGGGGGGSIGGWS